MSLECCLTAGIRWTAVKKSVTHDDDLPGIARPAAAVFSSLSAMAAGVIIHRALRPTPARMELHPLRQYWLEPRAINIAPLATSTVLFYATIIIGRSDGTCEILELDTFPKKSKKETPPATLEPPRDDAAPPDGVVDSPKAPRHRRVRC